MQFPPGGGGAMGEMPPLGSPRFLLVLASILLRLSPGSLLPPSFSLSFPLVISLLRWNPLLEIPSLLVCLLIGWLCRLCGRLCFPSDPVGLACVGFYMTRWTRLIPFRARTSIWSAPISSDSLLSFSLASLHTHCLPSEALSICVHWCWQFPCPQFARWTPKLLLCMLALPTTGTPALYWFWSFNYVSCSFWSTNCNWICIPSTWMSLNCGCWACPICLVVTAAVLGASCVVRISPLPFSHSLKRSRPPLHPFHSLYLLFIFPLSNRAS